MKTTKITTEEYTPLTVSSLPTRPTAPASFGGKGFTPNEMKAAFDALPLLILERLNSLIEDVSAEGEDSIAAAIPTGIAEGQSLLELMGKFTDGSLPSLIAYSGDTLDGFLTKLRSELDELIALKQEIMGGGA